MMKMNGGSPTRTMEEGESEEPMEVDNTKEVKSLKGNLKDALKENHDNNQKLHTENDVEDKNNIDTKKVCNGDVSASASPKSSKDEDSLNEDIAETLKALDELKNGVTPSDIESNNENKGEKDEQMELDDTLETKDGKKEEKNDESKSTNCHEKEEKSISEKAGHQNNDDNNKEKSLGNDAPETPKEKSQSSPDKKDTETAKKSKETRTPNKHSKIVLKDTHEESEKMRPIAAAIHSLGVDLVRQQMYKELIRVQTHKQGAGKLSISESSQLDDMVKLEEKLKVQNRPYELTTIECDIENCDFRTESFNVMAWHKEFCHIQGPNTETICAICTEFKSSSSQETFQHMDRVHNRKGRFYVNTPLFQCNNCPFECNTRPAYKKHSKKCDDTFRLKRNLEPTPQDCDIPTKKPKVAPKMTPKPVPVLSKPYKPPQIAARPAASPQLQSVLKQQPPARVPQQTVKQTLAMQQKQPTGMPGQITVGGQLYTIVLSKGQYVLQPVIQVQTPVVSQPVIQVPITNRPAVQITQPNTHSAALAQQLKSASPSINKISPDTKSTKHTEGSTAKGDKSSFEICEICGGFVKDKESLRVHFYWAHKVDIHEEVFKRKNPHLKCGLCQANFWTYQGLAKHREQKHSKKSVYTCFICGMKGTQILSHMKIVHNLTLDKALSKKVCLACGLQFRDVASTQSHIFQTHKSIFKEEVSPQKAAKDKAALTQGSTSESGGRAVPTGLFKNNVPSKTPLSSPKGNVQKEVKKKYTPVCSICNIPFPNLDAFTAHCNEKHIFKCYRCGEKWSSAELRHRHWLKAHKSDVDTCPICKENVVVGRPFIRHVNANHIKDCSVQVKRMNKKDFDYYMNRLEKLTEELAKKKTSNASVIVLDDSDDEKIPPKTCQENSKPGVIVKTLKPVKDQEKSVKPSSDQMADKSMDKDSEDVVVDEEILTVDGEQIVVKMASDAEEENAECENQNEKSESKNLVSDDSEKTPNGKILKTSTQDTREKQSDVQNEKGDSHSREVEDEEGRKAQKKTVNGDELKTNNDKKINETLENPEK